MKKEHGVFDDLAEKLKNLPDNEETRRRALLLKEFLVADENAKTRIADIDNGIFRDTLSSAESAIAEKLFGSIKEEFEIATQKDLMDLWLMIALFVKTKRFIRIDSEDLKTVNTIASIQKKFLDSYGQLGRELGITRQQRLVRKVSAVDDTGSITELFAGITQVEMDTPKKRKAKKKKDGIEIEVVED